MNKALLALAFVVTLGLGFGIGALVFSNEDDGGNGATTGDRPPSPSPTRVEPNTADGASDAARDSCLSALETVEARSEADEEGRDVLAQYESVLRDAVEALQDLDTPRLEQILSRVERLNDRAEKTIDQASDADVSEAVETCREALGVPS